MREVGAVVVVVWVGVMLWGCPRGESVAVVDCGGTPLLLLLLVLLLLLLLLLPLPVDADCPSSKRFSPGNKCEYGPFQRPCPGAVTGPLQKVPGGGRELGSGAIAGGSGTSSEGGRT